MHNKERDAEAKTFSITVDVYARSPESQRFRGFLHDKIFSRFASATPPYLKEVFAEGEIGIPKGHSPLAAGGEVT